MSDNNNPSIIFNESGNYVLETSPWKIEEVSSNKKPNRQGLGDYIGSILIVGNNTYPDIIKKPPKNHLIYVDENDEWANLPIEGVKSSLEITEKVTAIEKDILEIKEITSTIPDIDILTGLGSRVANLESFQELTSSNLVTIEGTINGLESSIIELSDRIGENESSIPTLQTDLGNLTSRVDTTETDLGNLTSRTTTIENDVGDLKSRVTDTEADISLLDGETKDNESEINANKSRLSTIETDISTNSSKTSSLETDISTIFGNITTIESDVSTVTSDVSSVETDISNIFSKTSSLEADISTIFGNITTIESNISTVTSDVSSVETDVSNIFSNITTIQSDLSTVESNFSRLNSDVNILEFNVSSVESDITTIQSDLSTVESDIVTLKEESGGIFIKGLTEEDEDINKETKTLSFNKDSGFNLTSISEDEIEVSLGSHFKTINFLNNDNIVAEGQDTLNLEFNDKFVINTDALTKTISIDLDESIIASSNIFLSRVIAEDIDTSVVEAFSDDGFSINSFQTNSTTVTIEIEFDGGNKHYRGEYYLDGENFDSYSRIGNSRFFKATKLKSLASDTGVLEITSDNGGKLEIDYSSLAGIEITNASLDSISPSATNQTKAKRGDTVNLTVDSSKNIHAVEVKGADFKSEIFNINSPSSSVSVLVESNYQGVSDKSAEIEVRVQNEFEVWSEYQLVSSAIVLNNTKPEINSISVSYSNNLEALKSAETATITFSAVNTDSITYSSSELSDTNMSMSSMTFELTTQGTNRGYRVQGKNITLIASLESNNSQTEEDLLVKIADSSAAISTVNNNYIRATEGSPSTKTININTTQIVNLTQEESISLGNVDSITGNNSQWNISITIDSPNTSANPNPLKLKLDNLANIETIVETSYFYKGFKELSREIDTNITLEVELPFDIVDSSKLLVSSYEPYPPFNYKLVNSFSTQPDEFKVIGSKTIEFNAKIREFLTGIETPGRLVVYIEELL